MRLKADGRVGARHNDGKSESCGEQEAGDPGELEMT